MAWKASITNIRTIITDNEAIYCHADYYDDANASVVLYARDFRFPITQTKAEMQAAIVSEGQKARLLGSATAAIKVQVPEGTVVNIP